MRNEKISAGRFMLIGITAMIIPACMLMVFFSGGAGIPGRAFQPVGSAEEHSGEEQSSALKDDHAEENTHPEHEDGDADHAGHDHDGEEEEEHAEHGDGGMDAHTGHDHESEGLRLTPEQEQHFGITIEKAGAGKLRNEVRLPGEVVFNEDRLVHLVPRVAGIVREASKTIGDHVEAGEVIAVLDSRELAEARAELLTARERLALAQSGFDREKVLWQQKISAEREYLEARQALAEARIALNAAEQKLHALGFDDNQVKNLSHDEGSSFTRYELKAPFAGVIIEKHITLGEALQDDTAVFTIADTSTVWVNLTVYLKNIDAVRSGQEVVIESDHGNARTQGSISMVTPFVEEATRSATARVVLDNSSSGWLPGSFVTGFIRVSEDNLPVVIPRSAIQQIEGRDVVFVAHEGSYEVAPVVTGRMDRSHAEILSGLKPGTPYVGEGAFQLKATIITSTLDSHAGHGH